MADVRKYLTHRAQLFIPERTAFADATAVTTLTSISTVACFAYFGESTRQFNTAINGFSPGAFEQNIGWFVILPNSFYEIPIGCRIDSITDNFGAGVRGIGVVAERVVYRHHRRGVQFVQVRLNEN